MLEHMKHEQARSQLSHEPPKRRRASLTVCGLRAVETLGSIHPEKIHRFFFTPVRAKRFGPLCAYLAARKRLYRSANTQELERLTQSVHHQGVAATIDEPRFPAVTHSQVEFWVQRREFVVLLDRVGDAHNLGAIIRSAAFFGVHSLVVSDCRQQAQVTSATYRVAQGGMEFVQLLRCTNAQEVLEMCAGKMTRVGASPHAFRSLTRLSNILSPEEAVILVLGNEETGLSEHLTAHCDHLCRIAGSGQVESLNVAQAGALFFVHYRTVASISSGLHAGTSGHATCTRACAPLWAIRGKGAEKWSTCSYSPLGGACQFP